MKRPMRSEGVDPPTTDRLSGYGFPDAEVPGRWFIEKRLPSGSTNVTDVPAFDSATGPEAG
jgi:hypothetical protein